MEPVVICLALFIGLPWIVFHYITKWKSQAKITPEDENLLDEMYQLARRLESRVETVERIVAADHPDFRLTSERSADGYRPSLDKTESRYRLEGRN